MSLVLGVKVDPLVLVFSCFLVLVGLTLFVWLPGRTKTLFGLSFFRLRASTPTDFAKVLQQALTRVGVRVEQAYFDLPTHTLLAISRDGQRILLSTASWQERLFSADYWLTLERLRAHTSADEVWSIRPGIDGSWTEWLSRAELRALHARSFSQLFHWMNLQRQESLSFAS
jgi:hypothetical protein